MTQFHIDFADVIHSLHNVPKGQDFNYDDKFIDNFVDEWENITRLIDSLPNLKGVYFTRKTFGGIPHIATKISEIRQYCIQKQRFCLLETPSRFSNQAKIDSWTVTIIT